VDVLRVWAAPISAGQVRRAAVEGTVIQHGRDHLLPVHAQGPARARAGPGGFSSTGRSTKPAGSTARLRQALAAGSGPRREGRAGSCPGSSRRNARATETERANPAAIRTERNRGIADGHARLPAAAGPRAAAAGGKSARRGWRSSWPTGAAAVHGSPRTSQNGPVALAGRVGPWHRTRALARAGRVITAGAAQRDRSPLPRGGRGRCWLTADAGSGCRGSGQARARGMPRRTGGPALMRPDDPS